MKIRIKDCQREFLSLTKAFSVSSTCLGFMRNLVGKYTYYYLLDGKKNIMKEPGANDLWLGRSYMEFSTKFWIKPGNYVSGENKWVVL